MTPFQEDALTCGYSVNSRDEVYQLTYVLMQEVFCFRITLVLAIARHLLQVLMAHQIHEHSTITHWQA
uniref:hypothetical protein n=1 Tax=Klebsiella pneumoniae TaxID=573 RepID=UPI000813B176|nr:hypothetical protein [Klebsiella pneumoniae]